MDISDNGFETKMKQTWGGNKTNQISTRIGSSNNHTTILHRINNGNMIK
jgi:hypothetical protein